MYSNNKLTELPWSQLVWIIDTLLYFSLKRNQSIEQRKSVAFYLGLSTYWHYQCTHVCIYIYTHTHTHTQIGTCCAFQLTVYWPGWDGTSSISTRTSTPRTSCCIHIYSIPPDEGLQICPKHVEVEWRNKLRTNSASIWFCYTDGLSCRGKSPRVFYNEVLGKILEPKRDDMTGAWTKLHNKDFRICTRSSNSIQVIKLSLMGRGYGNCGGEERCIQGLVGGNWGEETTWKIKA